MLKKLNIAALTVLVLFQTIFMPFSTYGVTFADMLSNELSVGSITENIMTLVELSQEDATNTLIDLKKEDYRVDVNKRIQVLYTLELPEGHPYKNGDTYKLKLPDSFKFTQAHDGVLNLGDGTTFGTFHIEPDLQTVTFTFNNAIENHEVEGKFGAWVEFTEGVKNGELTQIIRFENPEKEFTIHFLPSGGEISKSAIANKLMNADEVTWTVDINKASRIIKNAELKDTTKSTPENHTLNGEIKVYKISKVLINGNVEVESQPYKTFTSFPIDLGEINEPYRVVYSTKLTEKKSTQFTNIATLTGLENGKKISLSDTFDIELPFYNHLAKQKQVTTEEKPEGNTDEEEKPTNPEKPTEGGGTTVTPPKQPPSQTESGKNPTVNQKNPSNKGNEVKVPNVNELITSAGKNPSKIKDAIKQIEDFMDYYNSLSKAEQQKLASVNIDEMLKANATLKAKLTQKLPQTDATSNAMLPVIGLILIVMSGMAIIRRRKMA